MQLSEYQCDSPLQMAQIKGYEPGKITVADKCYHQGIIISPQSIQTHAIKTLAELTAKDLACLIDMHPEVVLLGTGERQHFPAAEVLADLINLQIGTEVMDTAAACRTFNVLLAQSRQVVAFLLP